MAGAGGQEGGSTPQLAASSSAGGASAGLEDEDEIPYYDTVVQLSPEVEAAMAEVFPCNDALDRPDFNPIEYINTVFPSEQSLSSLDTFVDKLKKKIRRVDSDIQGSVRSQTKASQDGKAALGEARTGMAELFEKIRNIRDKAEYSERMVQEITRDIKSLDHAKRNLTASITTLNHLHMLVGGVDSLHLMTKKMQYGDAANLLGAVVNVMEHFEGHTGIARIEELNKRIEGIKSTLATQIVSQFRAAFRSGSKPDRENHDMVELREACSVVDVLSPTVKQEITGWFVELQLKDYRDVFDPVKQEAAWIDKIDRRYAWFKRNLTEYEDVSSDVFPESWEMAEKITFRFCEITREALSEILSSRRDEIDVKLLLFAMQMSTKFETWLQSKFKNAVEVTEVVDDADGSEDDEDNEDEDDEIGEEPASEAERIRRKYIQHKREQERAAKREARGDAPPVKRVVKLSKFKNIITKGFEPFMEIYVEAQDKALSTRIEAFVRNFKSKGLAAEQEEDVEDSSEATVFQSCTDLFVFFRRSMSQCIQHTHKHALFKLFLVFKKHLASYAQNMLLGNLPKGSALATILLKDAELKLTTEEQFLVCSILNTAEYSQETIGQLEQKLKEKIDAEYEERVDLGDEQDMYHEVISSSVQLLVKALETACEPALVSMTKIKWDTIEEVGDTSPYVSQIGKVIAQTVPFLRTNLQSSRKYFVNFCLKFANSFIPKLISYMYKAKNIGVVGAEQLLMDLQSIKQVLLLMPSIGSAVARKAPGSYTKIVTRGMAKAEMLIKVVMAPHDPPKLYVEDYLKLVGDQEGISVFQKILDVKGLSKREQQPLLEAFRDLAPSESLEGGPGKAADAAGAPRKSPKASRAKMLSTRKLEKLMKRARFT